MYQWELQLEFCAIINKDCYTASFMNKYVW